MLDEVEYILKIECHDLDNYYEVKSLELENQLFNNNKVNVVNTQNKLLIFCHIPIHINESSSQVKKTLMDGYGICNIDRFKDDKGKPTSKCMVQMVDVDTWLWVYKHGFHCCGKYIITNEKLFKPKFCKKRKQIGHLIDKCSQTDEICDNCSAVVSANQSTLINSNIKNKHICKEGVIKCVNCGLKHSASSTECIKYKLEYNRINRPYQQIISASGYSKSKYNKRAMDISNEKNATNSVVTDTNSTLNLNNTAVTKAMAEYKNEQQVVNDRVNNDLKRIEARVDVTNKNFKSFKKQVRTSENTVTNYLETLLKCQIKDDDRLQQVNSELKAKNVKFLSEYKSSDEDGMIDE